MSTRKPRSRARVSVTGSSNRGSRGRASAARAKAKTTSSGKAAGSNPKVDGRQQRSKVSKAKVTSSGGGTKGSARVTASSGGSARDGGPTSSDARKWRRMNRGAARVQKVEQASAKRPGGSAASKNATPSNPERAGKARNVSRKMGRITKAAKQARARGATVKGGVQAAIVAETFRARPAADGTTKGKPNTKFGPAFDQPKQKKKKLSFNEAFRQNRKAGAKVFTWNGKKYHTRLKGEK